VLKEMGIEEDRFRLEWISAAEADRVRTAINQMVEKVRDLGPLNLELKDVEKADAEEVLV
jgi:F420-non-reducing hydrogenase iron-sulfur subunit